MKELSIEQKAQRYDEAYKKVAMRFGTNVADEIFPELKESEDEKIRKALVGYFMNGGDDATYCHVGIQRKDIIAWLEKQGKQNPI